MATESPELLLARLNLAKMEDYWDRKTQVIMRGKEQEYKDNSRTLEKRMEVQMRNLELFAVSRAEQQGNEALAYDQQNVLDLEKILEKKKEENYNRKLINEGKSKEAAMRKAALQEKAKLAEQEAQKRLQQLQKHKAEITTTCTTVLRSYEACAYKQYLPASCNRIQSLISSITDKADKVVGEAHIAGCGDVHMETMRILHDQLRNASDVINANIDEANKQGNEEKAEKEERERQAEEERTRREQLSQVSSAVVAAQQQGSVELCVDLEAYNEYKHLMTKLEELEKTIEPFLHDKQHSKLRFSLQKAINVPLNAISSVSGRHLRDKLQRFRSLLSGQTVEVGAQKVSASSHPLGISYCKHLLVKMIIKKADEQVTSKHETAFPIAMVTVGVCGEFGDVRELLLAYFYRVCPYLVPYYIGRDEGQSEQDYLKSRGYKFDNGVVEKQDRFLKRMSGYMHLYAALMVSPPPPGYPHTFHIQNAWLWLSRVLNIDPEPDVTATLLHDLLNVCGSAMFPMYKKQFSKLLRVLLTEYMSKIESSVISGGPVSRLRVFLQECVTSGRISEPDGLLRPQFWNT